MIQSESHYPHMEKNCTSSESSHKWPVYKNYFKSAAMIHPGGRKSDKASFVSVEVRVHDSMTRKRLGKNGTQGENHC